MADGRAQQCTVCEEPLTEFRAWCAPSGAACAPVRLNGVVAGGSEGVPMTLLAERAVVGKWRSTCSRQVRSAEEGWGVLLSVLRTKLYTRYGFTFKCVTLSSNRGHPYQRIH